MANWTNEQILWFLERSFIAARVRLSTIKSLAQVDLYHRDNQYPREAIADLENDGWSFGGSHDELPAGITGYFYEHRDISARRLRNTREILTRYLFPVPTPEDAPPPSDPSPFDMEFGLPPVSPMPAPEQPPQPTYRGTFQVIEVMLEPGTRTVVGGFWKRADAQFCANEAWNIEGAFRLIYVAGKFYGGCCWTPLGNEVWAKARQIAELT